MNKFNNQSWRQLFIALSAVTTFALQAAGFEKNVLWSGQYQGSAGAATSAVDNSEALFFNPAGLARVEGIGDVRLNFSPTFSTFKGPVSSTQNNKSSESGFSPIGGLTSAYRVNDTYVVGAGIFATGGTNSKFTGVQGGGFVGEAESSLRILEFSLGAAAKITEEWSVGAAWRASYSTAELSTVAGPVQLRFRDLSAWDFASFRIGTQYRKENFGLGLNFRTPIHLALEGEAAVSGAVTASDNSSTLKAAFPMQLAFGGDYSLGNAWTLFGELSWTNYAINKKLDIEADGHPVLDGAATNDITLKWDDQWALRLGTEWEFIENTFLRFGYVLVSQVTNSDYSRATFSSPGLGHSLVVGAGKEWDSLELHAAVDYSFASGKGKTAPANNPTTTVDGTFRSSSYTAHLGAVYNF